MHLEQDGKETKLKIGDVAIFRPEDGVIQIMRGSQRLLNRHRDDKTIVSNNLPLSEDLCSNVVNIIAMTHGFGIKNITREHVHKNMFYHKFTRAPKTEIEKMAENLA